MRGAQAVRFEQSPGFFNYIAFCKNAKEFSAQMPAPKLPADKSEYALCWYVDGSKANGTKVDGRIVVSDHHVRFMPGDPQFADTYVDLPREQVAVQHQAGQPNAILVGKDVSFSFRFSKLCPTCAPGSPAPPGVVPVLLDRNFALLDETILHFSSGWREIYRLSSGAPADSRSQAANSASSSGASPNPASPAAAALPPAPSGANLDRVTTPSTPTAAKGAGLPVSEPPRMKPVKLAAADALLVKRVPAEYPLDAKLLRLEGTVVLKVIVDKTGEVFQVNALSGPPLLESAAVDAVKQWQYKPYSVAGQPVDIETTVQVVFALDGSQPAARAQNLHK
jgi:TonB family protein